MIHEPAALLACAGLSSDSLKLTCSDGVWNVCVYLSWSDFGCSNLVSDSLRLWIVDSSLNVLNVYGVGLGSFASAVRSGLPLSDIALTHEQVDVRCLRCWLCNIFLIVLFQNVFVLLYFQFGGWLWLLASGLLVILHLKLIFRVKHAQRLALVILENVVLATTHIDHWLEVVKVFLRVIG